MQQLDLNQNIHLAGYLVPQPLSRASQSHNAGSCCRRPELGQTESAVGPLAEILSRKSECGDRQAMKIRRSKRSSRPIDEASESKVSPANKRSVCRSEIRLLTPGDEAEWQLQGIWALGTIKKTMGKSRSMSNDSKAAQSQEERKGLWGELDLHLTEREWKVPEGSISSHKRLRNGKWRRYKIYEFRAMRGKGTFDGRPVEGEFVIGEEKCGKHGKLTLVGTGSILGSIFHLSVQIQFDTFHLMERVRYTGFMYFSDGTPALLSAFHLFQDNSACGQIYDTTDDPNSEDLLESVCNLLNKTDEDTADTCQDVKQCFENPERCVDIRPHLAPSKRCRAEIYEGKCKDISLAYKSCSWRLCDPCVSLYDAAKNGVCQGKRLKMDVSGIVGSLVPEPLTLTTCKRNSVDGYPTVKVTLPSLSGYIYNSPFYVVMTIKRKQCGDFNVKNMVFNTHGRSRLRRYSAKISVHNGYSKSVSGFGFIGEDVVNIYFSPIALNIKSPSQHQGQQDVMAHPYLNFEYTLPDFLPTGSYEVKVSTSTVCPRICAGQLIGRYKRCPSTCACFAIKNSPAVVAVVHGPPSPPLDVNALHYKSRLSKELRVEGAKYKSYEQFLVVSWGMRDYSPAYAIQIKSSRIASEIVVPKASSCGCCVLHHFRLQIETKGKESSEWKEFGESICVDGRRRSATLVALPENTAWTDELHKICAFRIKICSVGSDGKQSKPSFSSPLQVPLVVTKSNQQLFDESLNLHGAISALSGPGTLKDEGEHCEMEVPAAVDFEGCDEASCAICGDFIEAVAESETLLYSKLIAQLRKRPCFGKYSLSSQAADLAVSPYACSHLFHLKCISKWCRSSGKRKIGTSALEAMDSAQELIARHNVAKCPLCNKFFSKIVWQGAATLRKEGELEKVMYGSVHVGDREDEVHSLLGQNDTQNMIFLGYGSDPLGVERSLMTLTS